MFGKKQLFTNRLRDRAVLTLLFSSLRVFQHTLAELWVQKTSEMNTSQQYHCRTFLGHLLNIGDLVMGFVLMT